MPDDPRCCKLSSSLWMEEGAMDREGMACWLTPVFVSFVGLKNTDFGLCLIGTR